MTPFLLVALGLLLIFIEFFLPGAIMGIAGGIIILYSIVLFATQNHSPFEVLLFIMFVLVSLGFLIAFTLRKIPKMKNGFSIYLKTDQEGYVASTFDPKLIGKHAKVVADLKPSGHILIDGVQYQASSQGEYITEGKEVAVIEGRGAYLIVKEI